MMRRLLVLLVLTTVLITSVFTARAEEGDIPTVVSASVEECNAVRLILSANAPFQGTWSFSVRTSVGTQIAAIVYEDWSWEAGSEASPLIGFDAELLIDDTLIVFMTATYDDGESEPFELFADHALATVEAACGSEDEENNEGEQEENNEGEQEQEEDVNTIVASDDRFCFVPGQAPAAVYSYTDGAGKTGLKVYAITGGNGTKVIDLDSAELAAIPGLPPAATLIAQGSPYNIALYKLPSGAFQINVDDGRVVKTHVCEFRGVPPRSITVTSFE